VGATADGRLSKEQLADGGFSPMVGRDKHGPTSVLKSVSKLDNYLTTNGSLLNVKFSPSVMKGTEGIRNFVAYLRSFMRLKIQHIQFNVVSADTLRAAQEDPAKYRNLVIRVAGYSAIFVELNKSIQDDIIKRTEHGF
jgi:formate C-acetyltransferase